MSLLFAAVIAAAAALAADTRPGMQPEVTLPDGCVSQEGAEFKDGRWTLPDGTPTFRVCRRDGKIITDWSTYNGYRRYHAECALCHGPNALGTVDAPGLTNALRKLDYNEYANIVGNGRVSDESGTRITMPGFSHDRNVMCFLNDLYAYLKARSFDNALPATQLGGENRDDKPDEVQKADEQCLG
ncbi:Cytochrome c553i [Hyphomicrobium sulfonivorans]|uniref:Cytochrome c553i n=1 Tax=Hyphomicrobium sulfonivorans TaxID=121290 RepID=A0A109BIV2_HYPSL|nr:hypothetical protein [Hyphomicrobium sulfonivorans]KWT69474.1 Cytochrome c553i [Hyphomicrobium sulfonivorans]